MPPQAYTRETLVKAIDWIASQPDSLRAQAKTADSVVALYLQAKRRTSNWTQSSSVDHAVSGEAFKEDLRSLARDLEQFTVPPTASNPPVQNTGYSQRPQPESPPQIQAGGGFEWMVDPVSLKRAQALKERLNLSSETEALRMMISLGFEHFQSLLP